MRTTILSLLTLTLGLTGCGGAGAFEEPEWNPIAGRYETGQTWDDIDPVLLKAGQAIVFPLTGTTHIEAGAQIVAFRRDNLELVTGDVMTSEYRIGFDGSLLQHDQAIGWVVYTQDGLALVTGDGAALHVEVNDGVVRLFESAATVPLADHDQAPHNDDGLPAARF